MDNFEAAEKYFTQLSDRYPAKASVVSEIVKLNAVLNLPKSTEHFVSDLHGENEAFSHIIRCASGVIRRKIEALFSSEMTKEEIGELATLVYYPKEKLSELKSEGRVCEQWYYTTISRLVRLCRLAMGKYTGEWVKKRINKASDGYVDIVYELVCSEFSDGGKCEYYKSIYKTVFRTGYADEIISALSSSVKTLIVDRVHVVGDIFDRGARPDIILDELISLEEVDVQWGNHDALWMGAAAGSAVCVATVLNNSFTYRNLEVIEIGYGISLRPLALFAENVYNETSLAPYMPRGERYGNIHFYENELLIAKMHKAISVIQFKLEGQTILRNPSFNMNDRLLLDKIDKERGTVKIGDCEYKLRESFFPTLNPENPYELSEEEKEVVEHLTSSFLGSVRLGRHISYMYEKGGMYKIFNRNLIFHGCIPLCDDGTLMHLDAAEGLCGRRLMDFFDRWARLGYFAPNTSPERERGRDLLWFLWCGKDSPLCARKRITTFERLLIDDKTTHKEPKNAYYRAWTDEKISDMILKEFSLSAQRCHIINGHIPVNKGENPIKAGGKLIVIDGGLSKAYHAKTGIAGYTLIYNADGMKISAHEPFSDKNTAVKYNKDILSETTVFEEVRNKIRIRDCDEGKDIRDKISDLVILLRGYENGKFKEKPL